MARGKQQKGKPNGQGILPLLPECSWSRGRRLAMGRARLARGALATIVLGVPAVGVLVAGGGVAMAAPLTTSQQAAMTLNQELASYAKTLEGIRYLYGG